jgi:hypothetical protein
MRWITLLLLASLAACADETTLPGAPLGWGPASSTLYTPTGAGGIAGDWLYCEDESCTSLTSSGRHFGADGTWASLYAYQWYEDGGVTYCLGWDHGTYAWSGNSLTLSDGQGGYLTCTVFLSGDRATVACGELYSGVMQRVDANPVEECPIYEDVPAPTGG